MADTERKSSKYSISQHLIIEGLQSLKVGKLADFHFVLFDKDTRQSTWLNKWPLLVEYSAPIRSIFALSDNALCVSVLSRSF